MTTVDELIEAKLCHEIHTSERRSFRACRRRWDWLFNDAWYPKTTAKPLEFGVAYHEAMEVYYDPDHWDEPRSVRAALAIIQFAEKNEQQRLEALDNPNSTQYDDEINDDYAERLALGQGMLQYYFTEVAPKEDQGWRPRKVEIGFRVVIPNPETGEEVIWCECENCWNKYREYIAAHPESDIYWRGLPVVYAGRIDMLAEDLSHPGNYYIFDWKTAAMIPQNHDFLILDDQVASYAWALWMLGINARGFVYHEQRKGYPQPPKQNATRRLGRLYSINRNQDTDFESYLECVRTNDKEAYEKGLYDEFLEYLKNDGIVYFSRVKIIKADSELQQIGYNIGLEALDMVDPHLRIYPSAGRFGCTNCAFQIPCMEKNAGGDWEFTLQQNFEQREHYYVRKEASTESKSGE